MTNNKWNCSLKMNIAYHDCAKESLGILSSGDYVCKTVIHIVIELWLEIKF
jgi:hypothetical protein